VGVDGNLIAIGPPLINPSPNLVDPNPPVPPWLSPAPPVPGTANPSDTVLQPNPPAQPGPPPAAPSSYGGNVGPVGGPQERDALALIMRRPATTATQLLLGPVARGTSATVGAATRGKR
jgi:hypothetical protein